MLRGETSAAGGFPDLGIWRSRSVSEGDTRRVVLGTTILKTAVRRIATTTMRATGTTTTVFVLCVLLRALFCTRTGGWEFVGRVEEESRPVPVMSVSQRCGRVSLRRRLRTRRVTASKNQTG